MLATNGDTHLGGEDFDQRVMQYFIKMIKKKSGTDISGDNRALQKLRREVGNGLTSERLMYAPLPSCELSRYVLKRLDIRYASPFIVPPFMRLPYNAGGACEACPFGPAPGPR